MSHRQVKRVRRAARSALVAAVSLDLLAIALPAHSQGAADSDTSAADALEEIVVRGVRGAQEAAIEIKRNTTEITDSIVMEDIGKLPDVTITDALQRVPGIQISRAAGEGSFLSIRGAPQIMATMNGERFVTAQNILDSTVSFEDVPADQITGVTVYKSQSAHLTDGGLGGLLDLQSIRALKLPEDGLTLAGNAQAGWGSIEDGTDTKFGGLIGYKFNDRLAMSLSGTYSDTASASSFQSAELDLVDEFSGWINPGNLPSGNLNGDGDATDEFLIPNGWNTYVNSRQFDRERLGLAYNFDMEFSDSMELVADVFYNDMDEGQHGQQLFVNGNFGGRQVFRPYTVGTGQPSVVDAFDTGGLASRANFVTDFAGYTNGLRGGVQSVFRDTEAVNTNLELRMGKGEKFSSTIRWVHADAERESRALTVAQQTDSQCFATSQAQADADQCTEINPSSIPTTLTYQIWNSLGSDQMNYVIGDQLRSLATAPGAWRMHSSWLEKNTTDTQMDVFRYDGKLEFSENLSLQFGLRYSDREMNEERSDYFSPSGLNGLLAKYQEVGYGINQTSNTAGFDYDPLPRYTLASPELAGFVTTVKDFGVNGLVTGFPMIDTRALEHPESIRDALYGPGQYIDAPDRTYGVEEKQSTLYFEANFGAELTDTVDLSGNVGVRVVKTDITVFQNLTDGTQLDPRILAGSDPNHTAYTDLGDVYTNTDRTRALPSFNVNFGFGDDLKLKTAYYETQALQPLQNLGRGPITFYNGEQIGETFQRVSSIQRLGNPRLEPWLSRSLSANLEWYFRDHSLLSAGVFYTDVDSYTFTRIGTDPTAPDSDGVVRLGAQTQDIAQGEGASYYGFEFLYKATFDFLPGFLRNTGIDLNYTFTPSQAGRDAATGEKIILADGSDAPFNGTAENQVNMVLFYQDDRFQARVAGNYLSKQYQGTFSHWSFTAPNSGLAQWQDDTLYIDAGASFDFNEHFQVFLQGSNLTEEAPTNYVQWPGAHLNWNQYERVISAGVRVKF